jgi:lysozyme
VSRLGYTPEPLPVRQPTSYSGVFSILDDLFRKDSADEVVSLNGEVVPAKIPNSPTAVAAPSSTQLGAVTGTQTTEARTVSDRIKNEEGLRLEAYTDPGDGSWRIGYGTESFEGERITEEEAESRHTAALGEGAQGVQRLLGEYGIEELDQPMEDALVQMAYQMGEGGLGKFDKMFGALQRGDRSTAVDEMGRSKWARQDTPARAARVIGELSSA